MSLRSILILLSLALAPLLSAQTPAPAVPPPPAPTAPPVPPPPAIPTLPVVASLAVDWSKVEMVSRSAATLQVVVNPPLRRGNVVHDGAFAALHDLGADYVRYVPWVPYPRLAVAELEPPTPQKTSWDFSVIDPMTIDFLEATKGHSTILNFSTIPEWMFITPAPVTYPDDPNKDIWNYGQGKELRDPSMKELGDYYARLVSWYANGGFTDENGQYHKSGYHYPIPYWEVFNEIEAEHKTTPEQYTARYDAVVHAIHAVSPTTKFVGLALGSSKHIAFVEYFLNPKNHQPGIPLDMISYHFYATPKKTETPDDWQNTFFTQADTFLQSVQQIEEIRKRLSPSTQTAIDELGVIDGGHAGKLKLPPIYWNAAGAMYAYLYVELSKLGIEAAGESQLVGYPTQFPSVSMIDWTNGKPNARFWILKLLKDNFGPGDSLVTTTLSTSASADTGIEAQAYQTTSGKKILFINKRNVAATVNLPADIKVSSVDRVNLATGENPAATAPLPGAVLALAPYEVAVLHLAP